MALKTENLCKMYGRRRVVDEVNINVESGEIVGLLGPNGAGKTTTFYSIVGFVVPDAGHIYLDGTEITDFPMYRRARQGIGYLPQETSIFRKLTVEQNIRMVLEMQGLNRAEQKDKLEELLDELNLMARCSQQADTLSGGETRRVEIARALATKPRYMLLDEPFAGIDPRTVEDLQTIIKDLQKKGLGILITDHNVREILKIASRSYVMRNGSIETEGTAQELISNDKVLLEYLGKGFQMDW